MKRLPTLAPLLFLLAACGTPTSPAAATPFVDPALGPHATDRGPSAPSTTLSPGQGIPAPVDCGNFTLDQGERLDPAAASCFVDAASAGRAARLLVSRPTVEGDPIPVTYTSRADGRSEVVTDSRADGFGPRQITTEICQGPSAGDYGVEFDRCVTK